MTTEEINALTDEQLVAKVGETVMEWTPVVQERFSELRTFFKEHSLIQLWRPLLDWNHCWQVVEAMRAKGWLFEFQDLTTTITFEMNGNGDVYGMEDFVVGDVASEHRAILRAALKALGCKQTKTIGAQR